MAWSVPRQAVRPEPRSSGSAAAASTTGPSKSTMPGISRAACTARVGDGVRAMSDDRLGGELVDPGGWRFQHPAGIVLDEAADGVGQQVVGVGAVGHHLPELLEDTRPEAHTSELTSLMRTSYVN